MVCQNSFTPCDGAIRSGRIASNLMDQIMIEKQKIFKSDFTEIEKDYVDIWELRAEEREHILKQIVKDRRKNRIRNWLELTFMLSFIYYMLFDMYKDGDLDTIIKFLKP